MLRAMFNQVHALLSQEVGNSLSIAAAHTSVSESATVSPGIGPKPCKVRQALISTLNFSGLSNASDFHRCSTA